MTRDLLARFPWLFRVEMRRRVWTSRVTRRAALARYLKSTETPRLHIGAGGNVLDGWFNTDVLIFRRGRVTFLDARRPFPIPDAVFAYVFTEHQIEHITYDDAAALLRECFRVLRSGGWVRVGTPDLAWVGSLTQMPLPAEQARYVAWMSHQMALAGPDAATAVNAMFRGVESVPGAGHKFLYSFDALRALLERAGFRDVRRCEMQVSEESALHGIERHGEAIGNEEIARMETLVVEARKP